MADTPPSQPASSSPAPAKSPTSASGSVPTLVKVISVLFYIGAAFLIIFALIMFVGGGFAGEILKDMGPSMNTPGVAAMTGAFLIIAGVFLLIFAALYVFLGIYLWKGKNWARIVTIVLNCLGVLFAIIGLITVFELTNLFGLVINGLMGSYLLFSKDVKAAFR